MHTITRRWILALALGCTACSSGNSGDEVFTREDLALIRSMALDPSSTPPIDVSNDFLRVGAFGKPATPAFRAALAAFGQQLFFDPGLSTPRADGSGVACATCHGPTHWFSDSRAENHVSAGVDWTGRNSPSLVNVGYYVSFGWDGQADSLWGQGKHAFEGAAMKGDKLRLAQQLARRYAEPFRELFGWALPPELASDGASRFTAVMRDSMSEYELNLIYGCVLKAWGAYLLELSSGNAPFDDFARGDSSALSPEQVRGLQLFIGKAGCITCHLGPHFTDNRFHSVGVQQVGARVPDEDLGRYTGLQKLGAESFRPYRLGTPLPPTEADKGKFRTKSLRHVAKTPPYFHAGQKATLADVVWFYNQGGDRGGAGEPSPFLVPLELSEAEQADVVAFLHSLTGTPVRAELSCNNALPPLDATLTPHCPP